MSEADLDHVTAFSCYLFTSDGRLLLTMRGHAKKAWPGIWANSCYGHPAPGESLPEAVSRTLRDELGISSAAELILPTSRQGMRADGELTGELCPVFRVVTDEPPCPDPVEVGDFEWVGWPEFVYAVATGDITVSPWCRPQVAELSALGDDPAEWPVADVEFPTAA
ncbi:isopentenyl-diphosphate Delta-isomerase [Actinophytocola oryzae]|uniref:isopentenyl-diphosphate Delta-isomerase n=1 Tax=Actinophytocola oryzae TaxID=502181 RepID=A0A4R7VWM6_9PSEU|nr:isopentenyl-diphosphate Delta-isomerase [Actinophytocola oryzae]TDV53627.1 isopentenyl-diphosphate delta-isomerase [Actinophytocola oryzae]